MNNPLLARVLERLEKAKVAANNISWSRDKCIKMASMMIYKMEENRVQFIRDADDFSLIIATLKSVQIHH